MRVLYLFAGKKRWGDIKCHLLKMTKAYGIRLVMDEFDVLRSEGHDLTDGKTWEEIMERIESGLYHTVLMAPPCEDFSRAKFSLMPGPPPARSKEHPRGYPGLAAGQWEATARANLLVDRALEAAAAAHKAGAAFLLEHPEDLGRRPKGNPASIWQWESIRKVAVETSAETVALNQDQFQGCYHFKCTRLLGTLLGMQDLGVEGWPFFDDQNCYMGPLPRFPEHKKVMQPLIGIDPETGTFRTRPSGAYPSGMCELIAKALFDDWLARMELEPLTPFGGGEVGEFTPAQGDPCKARLAPPMAAQTERPQEFWANHDTSDEDEEGRRRPRLGEGYWGAGPPLHTMVAGKTKPFHAGAGLCSPGRWPPERRQLETSGLSARLYMRWMRCLDSTIDVRRAFFTLAAGKAEASPFPPAALEAGRKIWREELETRLGQAIQPDPPEKQCMHLHSIHAHLKCVGDPDGPWLVEGEASALKGVRVGPGATLPRTPAVFERKVKWKKYDDLDTEDGLPQSRGNYPSANCTRPPFGSSLKRRRAST